LTFLNITAVELALGFGTESVIITATSAVDEGFAMTLYGVVGKALHIPKAPATDHRLETQFHLKDITD